MGTVNFNFRSQALGHYVDVTIIYPTDEYSWYDESRDGSREMMPGLRVRPVYQRGMKFQTVYLLHGGGDDHTLTYRYSNAERYAQDNRVMLVTPNIPNSFGVDTCYSVRNQTFLTEELPVVIQTLFASSPAREDNFIMGYAMGGNAALGAALARPDLYAACVDISGGIGLTVKTETLIRELEGDHFRKYFPLYHATFGEAEEIPGSRFDLGAIARQNADLAKQSQLFIACGSREFIRPRVEDDVAALRALGYRVSYEVAENHNHDFEFWDLYIRKALYELLPLKRAAVQC